MPARKHSIPATKHGPHATAGRDVAGIVGRREQLVAEIAAMRARGASRRLADKAEHLLTRWWSNASWSAREELLKSAAWLVRLAQVHDG